MWAPLWSERAGGRQGQGEGSPTLLRSHETSPAMLRSALGLSTKKDVDLLE